MLYNRKNTVEKISYVLSHIICQIRLNQKLNDLSLNIHAEDFFLEVFNFVYNTHYINANIGNSNEAYIDLVDHSTQKLVQITTSKSADKIKNSFKALADPKYINYSIDIYYLLEKPTPAKKTEDFIQKEYNVTNLNKHLLDFGDLLKDITYLTEEKIIELYKKHFASVEETYTDEIALQNVIETLVADFKNKNIPYDADYLTIPFEKKLELNKITGRVHREIVGGLDYTDMISDLDPEILTDLKELTVQQCYSSLIIDKLRAQRLSYEQLKTSTISDLHGLATIHNINFNEVMNSLKISLNARIYFNSTDLNCDKAIWSIIAYFFEICDIGVKNDITN